MPPLGDPVDKLATMPVYIVTVRELNGTKFSYIKTRKDVCDVYASYIKIRGCIITEASAKKIRKISAKEIDRNLGDKENQIDWFLPWSQIVKIEHITFSGVER